jgi:Tfp pilus assembly protein PilN
MVLTIATIVSVFLAIIFLVLWLRERRYAAEAEIVAYGLRAQDDSDDNTKTSISVMEAEYQEALSRLQELNQVHQDEWGNWVWNDTGEQLGAKEE